MSLTTNRSNMYYGTTNELSTRIGQQGEVALNLQTGNFLIYNGFTPGGSAFNPTFTGTLNLQNANLTGSLTVAGTVTCGTLAAGAVSYTTLDVASTLTAGVIVAGTLNATSISYSSLSVSHTITGNTLVGLSALKVNTIVPTAVGNSISVSTTNKNINLNAGSATITLTAGTVRVVGPLSVSSTLTAGVFQPTSISTGSLSVANTLRVTKGAIVTGSVSGASLSVANTLRVTKGAVVTGLVSGASLSVANTLRVTKGAVVTGLVSGASLSVANTLRVTKGVVVNGAGSINGDLVVGGSVSTSTLKAQSHTLAISAVSIVRLTSPSVSVVGPLSVSSTLTAGVFNPTTLATGTLSVTHQISGASLSITGAATIGGALAVGSTLTAGVFNPTTLATGTLSVTHQISGASLSITGAATIGGVLSVGGTIVTDTIKAPAVKLDILSLGAMTLSSQDSFKANVTKMLSATTVLVSTTISVANSASQSLYSVFSEKIYPTGAKQSRTVLQLNASSITATAVLGAQGFTLTSGGVLSYPRIEARAEESSSKLTLDASTIVMIGATSVNNALVVGGTLTADDLSVTNRISATSLNITGSATIGDLSVTNRISATSLNITGAATIGDLSVTNRISATSLNITGAATIGDLSVTNRISATSLNITGAATIGDLSVTNRISATSLNITGAATIGDLSVTNRISATSLNITGSATIGDLSVTNRISATSLNITGAATIGALSVTNRISATSLNIVGSATIGGDLVVGGSISTSTLKAQSHTLAISSQSLMTLSSGSINIKTTGASSKGIVLDTTDSTTGDIQLKSKLGITLDATTDLVLNAGAASAGIRLLSSSTSGSINLNSLGRLNLQAIKKINLFTTAASLLYINTPGSLEMNGAGNVLLQSGADMQISAPGDKIRLTANTISLVGAVSLANSLLVGGRISATSLNITGAATIGDLSVTNRISATSLNITGSATIGDLSVTNRISATSLNITGSATIGDLSVTNRISATSLNITGSATIGDLSVTNRISATSLNITGSATIGGDLVVGGSISTSTLLAQSQSLLIKSGLLNKGVVIQTTNGLASPIKLDSAGYVSVFGNGTVSLQSAGNGIRLYHSGLAGSISLSSTGRIGIASTEKLSLSTSAASLISINSAGAVSLVAGGAANMSLSAAGNKISLTAATIAVSGSLKVDNILQNATTDVTISATSFVTVSGGLGLKNTAGLFTTSYVEAIASTVLTSNQYLAIAEVGGITLTLPTTPKDGETHLIKALATIGSLYILTGANSITFDAASSIALNSHTLNLALTADKKAYGLTYVPSLTSWLLTSGYKA